MIFFFQIFPDNEINFIPEIVEDEESDQNTSFNLEMIEPYIEFMEGEPVSSEIVKPDDPTGIDKQSSIQQKKVCF